MLTLKWRYPSTHWHTYNSNDSAQIGQLYRLKALEPLIVQLELYKDGVLVISYTRPEEKE